MFEWWFMISNFVPQRSRVAVPGLHFTQHCPFQSAYVDGIIDQIPESHKNGATSGHLKKIICGGVAGVVSRTCTAPLDRLKVLLQVQGQQRVVGNSQSMGAAQMMRAMWKEGFFTMWKGWSKDELLLFDMCSLSRRPEYWEIPSVDGRWQF